LAKLKDLVEEEIENALSTRSAIKDFFQDQLEKAKEAFEKLAELAKEKFEKVKGKVIEVLAELKIKGAAVADKVKAALEDLTSAAKEEIEHLKPIVSATVAQAKEAAERLEGDAEKLLEDLIKLSKETADKALKDANNFLEEGLAHAKEVLNTVKEVTKSEVEAQIKNILDMYHEEADRLKEIAKEEINKLNELIHS